MATMVLAADEATFRESDHPRAQNGEFGAGGVPAGSKEAGARRSVADKIKAHAETFKKHGAETREWLKDKSAGEVLATVAKNEKTKEALSFALQSLLSHATGLDQSTWKLNEELIENAVHHFGDIAEITALQAKSAMRKAVQGLLALRAGPKAVVGDEADGVAEMLKALLDLLDDGEDDDEETPAEDAALAFDRNSVRTYDRDGHMHVAVTNISKANVCPYIGREIPDCEALGLDPDKVYQLLRDPDELAKAAPTSNGKQLLSRHVPVSADDHQPDLVIGAIGTDAEFVAPYLRNSLVVWVREAINDINSEIKKELSSSYRYRADMTPGTYGGVRYDGVMRDIVFNHVALVKEGRAGTDVVVGDSKESLTMATKPVVLTRKAAVAQGALLVYLKPKLAQDAKIDLTAMLAGLTAKNFGEKKAGLAAELKKQAKDKLAKDANVEDVVDLLDSLEKIDAPDVIEAAVGDPNAAVPLKDDKTMDAGSEELRALLTSLGINEENIAKILAMSGGGAGAMDETPEEKKAREEKEAKEKQAKDAENAKMKDMVTKPAMDTAIAAAVKVATDTATKTQREIREAERAVRPYVGDLAMAHDSADAVYKTALTTLGVKIDGIHPSAFPAILGMQQLPGTKRAPTVAMDAAGAKGFHERYPQAARIGNQ